MNTPTKTIMTLLIIASILIPTEAQVKFSDKIGGSNGSNFMIPSSRTDILSAEQIIGIAIQHSRRIEQIVVEYADEENFRQVESIGNDAGEWSYIDLEEGEFITYITGRAGTLIDQITFYTSMRRTFGPYGGQGGKDFEISIPSNAKVIGFTGQAGPSINQIGLIYKRSRKTPDISKNIHRGTIYHGTIAKGAAKQPTRIVRDHRTSKLTKMIAGYTLTNFSIPVSQDSMVVMKSPMFTTREVKRFKKKNRKNKKKINAQRQGFTRERKVRDQRKIK